MFTEKMIPNREDFTLEKIKLTKNGSVAIQYELIERSGDEVYTNHYKVDLMREIHPSFRVLFMAMKPMFGNAFEYTTILSEIPSCENEAALRAKDVIEDILDNIEIKGISLSGQDDNRGVIISSSFRCKNGLTTNLNTPRIKLSVMSFGFEDDLEELISYIEEEAYQYLFKGKTAPAELFGENPPTE